MWSKKIEKRRKANGLKKERLEKSNPLETSSPFFLFLFLVGDGRNLGDHWLKARG
jgi:hypothetical protein